MRWHVRTVAVAVALLTDCAAAGLLPSCDKPGYSKTIDPTGSCGVYRCTSPTSNPYCPCPFLYKDVSTALDGSSCNCLLAALCRGTCPEGYSYSNATSACTSAAAVADAGDTTFSIQLINMGDPIEEYESLFAAAAARWEAVIVGDLPDRPPLDPSTSDGYFAGVFGTDVEDYYGPVDDLVIGYRVGKIDGPSRTLAQATPLYTRSYTDAAGNLVPGGKSGIPISAYMQFDIEDIGPSYKDGTLETIILHEMGHALGIGTIQPTVPHNCASTCTAYSANATGVCNAQLQYTALGLKGQLLLETNGGRGTVCSHWSERLLRNELMTGVLDKGVSYHPLTAISIGALEDIGYKVNYAAADPLEEPASRRLQRQHDQKHAAAAEGSPRSEPQAGATTTIHLTNDTLEGMPLLYAP